MMIHTVFVDMAGFSAITDVYGDASALAILERFEALVLNAVGQSGTVAKWIGDEAMLVFADPATAILAMGRLIPASRTIAEIPLIRVALHDGPVVERNDDVFGATVNIASRIADAASRLGIASHSLGSRALRSVTKPVELHSVHVAREIDPAWIDPVCKMAASQSTFETRPPGRALVLFRRLRASLQGIAGHIPGVFRKIAGWLGRQPRYRRRARTML
ncbi:adenylate/guanylate cyclase domain-containing protein [Nitratireductor arenosus]|uniref:adenylate/guanylate cyclase domain-containing protein n=1 Tax=Nitratireductor arenosus TaxID=2682096 RepID=UPI001FE45240|nr:adenylate/guanylate cyclase domain-containing protein [Nitratireductor arenosus]